MISCKHAALLSLLCVVLLTACQSAPLTPKAQTQLNLAISEEPSTLDLQRTSEGSTAEVLSLVCETLMHTAIEDKDQPEPWLAESWTMAPDDMSMTVTLRRNVKFHNGSAVDAEAVKASFERLQNSESSASPIYEDFQGITIQAVDPLTVVFLFSEAKPDFISLLINPYAAIISATAAQKNEQEFARKPVCTGPYMVQDWQSAQQVLLAQNKAYAWAPAFYKNQGPPLIDTVAIRFISESDIRYQALLNNELDVLSLSTPEQVATISSRPEQVRLYESWVNGISFVGFNYRRTPTDELIVRQALAHAIDKETIVKAVLAGLAEPINTPLSPNIFGYAAELKQFGYAFDPQKSRQLLAQVGFADSDGDGVLDRNGKPLSLVLLTTTSSTYEKIATLIQSQFRDIGAQLSVKTVPASEIPDITPTGDFDLLLYHYSWGTPDALQLFLGTERIGASNRVAYSNLQVDESLRRAEEYSEQSTEKRELLFAAQRQILQDAPWQPLLNRKIVTAVNSRVQGIKLSRSGGLLWHDAMITQPQQ